MTDAIDIQALADEVLDYVRLHRGPDAVEWVQLEKLACRLARLVKEQAAALIEAEQYIEEFEGGTRTELEEQSQKCMVAMDGARKGGGAAGLRHRPG